MWFILPPYHCDLNPVELVWAMVKNRVAKYNTTFKLADVQRLTEDSVRVITSANWQEVIRHTDEIVDKYWEVDHIQDEEQQLLVEFDEDESDESEEGSEEEYGEESDN